MSEREWLDHSIDCCCGDTDCADGLLELDRREHKPPTTKGE